MAELCVYYRKLGTEVTRLGELILLLSAMAVSPVVLMSRQGCGHGLLRAGRLHACYLWEQRLHQGEDSGD